MHMNVEIKLYLDGVEFELYEDVSFATKTRSDYQTGHITDFSSEWIEIYNIDTLVKIRFEDLRGLLKR